MPICAKIFAATLALQFTLALLQVCSLPLQMDFSHGVIFTPQSVQQPKIDVWMVMEDSSIKYVRIYWVDWVNICRCRIVPIKHFKALLNSNRPGVNIAKVCLGLINLTVAPGFIPIGEYLYAVDLGSLKPAPFAPGHLAVLGHFEEKMALPNKDGRLSVAVELCPRSLLERITEKIRTEHGTEFLVGFETEFILLSSTDPVEPVNVHNWSASVGLLAGSREAIVLQEISDSLIAAGISLEMLHAEAAPGQYEVVTGPLTPVDAADTLVYTREIIVQVAAKHGLHATFAPRPFMYSAGSSAHAHISIHSANEKKPEAGLSQHESQFLAGLLKHLRAIVSLTLPTTASYKRMTDGVWSGGTWVNWGTENREAPVRLTNVSSPASRNFELRFVDGTANPHLGLAGILAGGLLGFDAKLLLEVKDCPGPKSAAQMNNEERLALGIKMRMPLSCEEGRKSLEEDTALRDILGEEFVDKYLAVNRTLDRALIDEKESEEKNLTRLVRFY